MPERWIDQSVMANLLNFNGKFIKFKEGSGQGMYFFGNNRTKKEGGELNTDRETPCNNAVRVIALIQQGVGK